MYLLFLWSFSILIEFELPCESESVLLIGTPYPPQEVISFIIAKLEMAKSDLQMWKNCICKYDFFLPFWYPPAKFISYVFTQHCWRHLQNGKIFVTFCKWVYFAISFFFCHDKINHLWNFVFFFILLHFSHLRCV